MTLSSGQRLGPYEIVAPVGAGGMGEVYEARDTRLDRSVAIKVLPAAFSENAALKARFDREAKTISSLNHPNICTLHDVGHDGGVDYLVMEYLEGDSLADRLRKGPLPLEQVIRVGIQVASALDAAHRRGIVHRDLKPGNVMLTKTGAKLLDFGLAKEGALSESWSSVLPDQPTEHKALTAEGTIVGTFQYMAPEQLEGSDVDARTDIFALGTVLYEMVTGARAFGGKTKTSLIAAIVSSEPAPISTVQPMSPPALEHVVGKCLAKDPDDRWQSASDVASELQWISEAGSQAMAPVAKVSRRRRLDRAGWLIAGLVVGLIAGWLGFKALRGKSHASPITHFSIAASAGHPFFLANVQSFAISPDGSTMVFIARTGDGNATKLYLRHSDRFDAVALEGTESAVEPVFSPDGQWIAFYSRGKIQKVSVAGGLPIDLCEFSGNGGANGVAWDGDRLVFNYGFNSGIWSVPANGGQKKLLFNGDPKKNEGALIFPRPLPDRKHLLFTIWRGGSFDDADIAVRSLDTGEQKIVVHGGSDAWYLPTGYLVYGRAGSLMAVAFDPDRLEVRGSPIPILDDVATGTINGEAHFAFANDGTILYATGGILKEERDLVWVDRDGHETEAVPTRRNYNSPALSPDGRRVAVTIEASNFDIWMLDLARDSISRVSFGANDSDAVWSPDGSRVAWSSTRTGESQVFSRAADGSGAEIPLTAGATTPTIVKSWLPGEKSILVYGQKPGSPNGDLFLWPLEGDRALKPVLQTPFDEDGRASPDGKWLAFSSNESGRSEIYVTALPGPGPKSKVSSDGGTVPVWSRDGREIFFRQDTKLFAASFDPAHPDALGRPKLLFDGPYLPDFDVSNDGKRFLMVRYDVNYRTIPSINVVRGWFDELRKRVPTN